MNKKHEIPPFSTKTGYVLLEIEETFKIVTILVIPRKNLAEMKKLLTKPLPNDKLWFTHS